MVFTNESGKIFTPHSTESSWADGGGKQISLPDDVSRAKLEAPRLLQRAPETTSPQETLASSIVGIWRVDGVHGDPLTQRLAAHCQRVANDVDVLTANVFNLETESQSARTDSGFAKAE